MSCLRRGIFGQLFGVEFEVLDGGMPVNQNYGRPEPGNEPWIRLPVGDNKRLQMERSLPLTNDEAILLRAYVVALHEFALVPSSFATSASDDVLMRAIAVRCNPNSAKTVESVLQQALCALRGPTKAHARPSHSVLISKSRVRAHQLASFWINLGRPSLAPDLIQHWWYRHPRT